MISAPFLFRQRSKLLLNPGERMERQRPCRTYPGLDLTQANYWAVDAFKATRILLGTAPGVDNAIDGVSSFSSVFCILTWKGMLLGTTLTHMEAHSILETSIRTLRADPQDFVITMVSVMLTPGSNQQAAWVIYPVPVQEKEKL
jgi:hypothetical protein